MITSRRTVATTIASLVLAPLAASAAHAATATPAVENGAPPASATGSVQLYGPGGPAPAMKEAARAFSARHGVPVNVTAGPTPKWVSQAMKDADIIYSGAENMMTSFAKAMPGLFNLEEAEPLYLRPVAILVRPGNPKQIRGFESLLTPGLRVMIVAGAGQVGLWEDVAGRKGDIQTVRALRRNLVFPEPANSALARGRWIEDPTIDAWLIWNIWQVANPNLADVVEVEESYRIYRDTGAVLTRRGHDNVLASQFVEFLKSTQGRTIFAKWGWQS